MHDQLIRYNVHECGSVKTILEVLERRKITHIYVLEGENTDSGLKTKTTAKFNGMDKFWVDRKQLHPFLTEMRVTKTDSEIEVMRAATKVGFLCSFQFKSSLQIFFVQVTSQAHVYME